MPDDIDKSLLERLQALRGATSPQAVKPGRAAAGPVGEAKPASGEDPLTARLKSLRLQYGERSSSSSATSALKSSPKADRNITHGKLSSSSEHDGIPRGPSKDEEDVDLDAMFQTDIKTLEEMLGHVGIQDTGPDEPTDHEIRTLLDELSQSIPPDVRPGDRPSDDVGEGDADGNSDDEEHMDREADQVIARFRDEMELETTLGEDMKQNQESESESNERHEEEDENEGKDDRGVDHLALPSLPSNLDELPSTTPPTLPPPTTTHRATSADIDDITARMAILKASGAKPTPSIDLPSVPASRPSSDKAINRLTSKTTYTDEDMDAWCTVCLEDATLQCPACDDDVYCARCWREMHVGPAAAFDDRSHKAVIFTRTKKKKKVAVGAA